MVEINKTATFTAMHAQLAADHGSDSETKLRADDREVYTHSSVSKTSMKNAGNRLAQALHISKRFDTSGGEAARAQKREAGADAIRKAIDNEFGPGVGALVFQKVQDDIGGDRDLNKGVQRGDLTPMMTAALRIRDENQAQKAVVLESLDFLSAVPENATPLDVDSAVDNLRGTVLGQDGHKLNQMFARDDKPGFPDPAITDRLFSVKKPDGNPVFSPAEIRGIVRNALDYQVPKESEKDFLRGNQVAVKLMTASLMEASGGILGMIGNQMGLLAINESAKGTSAAGIALLMDDALKDLKLDQHASADLIALMAEIGQAIDADKERLGIDGPAHVKEQVPLRTIWPVAVTAVNTENAKNTVGRQATQIMQKASSETGEFRFNFAPDPNMTDEETYQKLKEEHDEHVAQRTEMNDALREIRKEESGYRQFTAGFG